MPSIASVVLKWNTEVATKAEVILCPMKAMARMVSNNERKPCRMKSNPGSDAVKEAIGRALSKWHASHLRTEFRQTVIVCGIGMFVLGAIGFGVLWLMDNLLPSFFDWLTSPTESVQFEP